MLVEYIKVRGYNLKVGEKIRISGQVWTIGVIDHYREEKMKISLKRKNDKKQDVYKLIKSDTSKIYEVVVDLK